LQRCEEKVKFANKTARICEKSFFTRLATEFFLEGTRELDKQEHQAFFERN